VLPNWPIGSAVGSTIEHLSAAFELHGLTFVAHPRAQSTRPISEIWKSITPAAVIAFEDFSAAETAEMQASGIDHTVVLLSRTARRRGELQAPEHQIGARQLRYVADAGHRRIGFAYPDDERVKAFAQPRLEGVRAACAELQLAEPEVRVVPLDPVGAELAVRSWRSVVQPVTAVCAYNDEVAMAVLAGMRRIGLVAPVDMAVIGVDDIPAAALTDPPLTTITHNYSTIAEQTATAVVRALAGQRPLARRTQSTADDVVLVRRESV
jgi:DNA-binding LacI/PurR family transcriptional regulator